MNQQNDSHKVVLYRDKEQAQRRGILIREGNKWAHIICMTSPIKIIKMPVGEGYEETGQDPVKARAVFLDAARTLRIKKSALDALGYNGNDIEAINEEEK